jgi:hypothetical protein
MAVQLYGPHDGRYIGLFALDLSQIRYKVDVCVRQIIKRLFQGVPGSASYHFRGFQARNGLAILLYKVRLPLAADSIQDLCELPT